MCFALGQISEHCQPEVLIYSSQVLPVAFALLDDKTFTVHATSCYVLEMFCEKLELCQDVEYCFSATHIAFLNLCRPDTMLG